MRWFVVLIGAFWIILGIFSLLASKRMKLALSNLIQSSARQTLGLVGLIFGILLLISAFSVREDWFIVALGIIAALKGITTLLMSEENFKIVTDWCLACPDIVFKGWAIFLLVLGIVMFYIF